MTESDAGASSPRPGPPREVDLGVPSLARAVEIGRGAAGVVYRAEQPGINRTVAVKMLPFAAMDDMARQRFERECQSMGALSSHPGIVTVYDAGFTPSGQPYLIMELMEGGSLQDRLSRQGAFAWQEAVEIGIRLAGALDAAHQKGVLHRDVKPDNVLISSYGEAKLADFSIARMAGASQTQTGLISATPAHAAPEIIRGEPPTPQSDVYSLGSTLLTLLLGHPAFVRDTDSSIYPVLTRVERDPVPDLRPAGVPDPVCRVLERSMAKHPGDRPASAAALAAELVAARDASPSHQPSRMWAGVDPAATIVMPGRERGTEGGAGWNRRTVGLAAAAVLALAVVGTGTALAVSRHGSASPASSTVARAGDTPTATTATPSGDTPAATGSTPAPADLSGLLVPASALPPGYAAADGAKTTLEAINPCNVTPDTGGVTGEVDAGYQATDVAAGAVHTLSESVASFPPGGAERYLASVAAAGRSCTTYLSDGADATVALRGGAVEGDQTVRFDVHVSAAVDVVQSVVLVRRGERVGLVSLGSAGSADDADADAIAALLAQRLA